MRQPGVRGSAVVGAIGLVLVLAGCGLWPFGEQGAQPLTSADQRPQPLPSAPLYTGSDAATVTVRTTQVGCCYMEGSLRFARLEGPTSREWAVDDGSNRVLGADTYLIGVQRVVVKPGHYTLAAWERVCDGSCEYLDPSPGECTAEFDASAGREVMIEVTFPIPDVCSVQLSKDS